MVRQCPEFKPAFRCRTYSYNKRNGIIHRGDSATEDDARRALEVALNVVKIMGNL